MLFKMRWRFIKAAMIATFIALVFVVGGINVAYSYISGRKQDATIDMLMKSPLGSENPPTKPEGDSNDDPQSKSEGKDKEIPPERPDFPGDKGMEGFTFFLEKNNPEMRFMNRYFTVTLDSEGKLVESNVDNIVSVSEDDAVTYAEAVYRSSKQKGYYKGYRYAVAEASGNKLIFFLNISRDTEQQKTVFLISIGISVGMMLIIFVLLFFLSKRAINPYVKAMEQQKQFITNAGHELKTPLTSISTSADVLSMDLPENEWIDNIRKQIERMTKLVGDLVMLSRFDEATPFSERSRISLSEILSEAVELFVPVAEGGKRSIEDKISDSIYTIGDESSIKQLISILLDNAIKYSPENSIISLELKKKKNRAYIIVSNKCAYGIPKELDRLFDRFYRPDESRSTKTGGYGIGLSMARAIAEAHKGTIKAKDLGDERIAFEVKLPIN